MKSTFKVSSQAFDISSLFAAKFKFSFLYIIYHPSQSIFKYTLLNVNQCIARLPLSPRRVKIKGYVQTLPECDALLEQFQPKLHCLSNIWTIEVLFKQLLRLLSTSVCVCAAPVPVSVAGLPCYLFLHRMGNYLPATPKTFLYSL